MSSPPKQAVAKTITQSETSLQPDSIGAAASKTVALGGVNAKAQRAVLAAEQEAAVAELARRIEAEAEQSYALHAEAQQVQAERERVAHAEAEKAAMLEFAESIGTTVRFEDNDNSITGASPAVDDDGRKSHKQPPPWKMTHMQPGTNLSLQTDQLARELSTEVGNLRGRLESGSGQAPRLRPVSAAAPTPSMIGPRLEMICDNLGALPVRNFTPTLTHIVSDAYAVINWNSGLPQFAHQVTACERFGRVMRQAGVRVSTSGQLVHTSRTAQLDGPQRVWSDGSIWMQGRRVAVESESHQKTCF